MLHTHFSFYKKAPIPVYYRTTETRGGINGKNKNSLNGTIRVGIVSVEADRCFP
jgi:hypothetical protein